MESSNLSLSTFSQSTYLYVLSLLICTLFKQLQHELERHTTTFIEQNKTSMDNPSKGKSQGERFSIPQGWNNYFKQFDNDLSRGFERPGNLCFRNATILLLIHTPGLFNWLRVYMERHTPECPSRDCALCTLYQLMGAYWSEDRLQRGHEKWMNILWDIMVKFSPEFKTGQHDVPEFLEMFFNKMLYDPTDIQHHADLDHMFKVINIVRNICGQCNNVGSSAEISYLALPGSFQDTKQPPVTVENAVRNHLDNSQMDANCTECNATISFQCEQIMSPPENLFIQIHRGNSQNKIHAQIQFENNLTIPEELKSGELLKTGKLQYELYAVIFHTGKLASQGHYSIAIKGPSRAWIHINDTDVKILQETEFFASQQNRQDAYMLAYRRVPTVTDWRKPKQTKPPSPPNPLQIVPAAEFQPQGPRLHESNPGIYDQQAGWTKVEQTIMPEGASMPFIYINHHNLLPGMRFAPKSQNVPVGLKLTLPTGEVLEGAGEILLTLSEEQRRIKDLTAITSAEEMKEQNIEPPIVSKPKPKPARRGRTARRPRRQKRTIRESSESDETYEPRETRKSKRIQK